MFKFSPPLFILDTSYSQQLAPGRALERLGEPHLYLCPRCHAGAPACCAVDQSCLAIGFMSLFLQGDSGGSLVCEVNAVWVQVGIVSWGVKCGQEAYPAAYTDVIQHKKWVEHVVSQVHYVDFMGVCVLLLWLCNWHSGEPSVTLSVPAWFQVSP